MRMVMFILAAVFLAAPAFAGTQSLLPLPKLQFFDNGGKPLTGGKVYTCVPGTTCGPGTSTPRATYTDNSGTVANANPVVLDAAGRASIWGTQAYKVAVYDAQGRFVYNQDNVPCGVNDPPAQYIIGSSGFGNLSSAKVAIGSRNATVYLPSSVSTNTLTIPANIELIPMNGATITVNSGKTLAYLGNTSRWPVSQVIAGAGTVVFGPGSVITPQWYGAKGDGVTNDNDAFAAASNTINAMGGGVTFRVPSGVYIVGKEHWIPGTGWDSNGTVGWFHTIYIANCTKPVVLRFEGTTLKRQSGMHFGMFNPVTGAAAPDNTGSAAQNGIMIDLVSCNSVVVEGNLELDGNNSTMVLGGKYGDAGWQLSSLGIRSYTVKELNISNVYSHNQGLDDFMIGYIGAVAEMPDVHTTLTNCRGEYSGRQGLSWVGGSNFTAVNCKFNHTGKGAFTGAPAAGIDIEAEDIIRNGVFINCEMVDNAGCAIVLDTANAANIAFYHCKFIGTTNYAVWANSPRVRFYDCTIVGGVTHLYTADAESATQFCGCTITDDVARSYNSQVYIGAGSYLMDFGGSGASNTLFDRCNFIMTRSLLTYGFNGTMSNSTVTIKTGTETLASGSALWNSNGATFSGVSVIDSIAANIPASPYGVPYAVVLDGRNTVSSIGGHIGWNGVTNGVVGSRITPSSLSGTPVTMLSGPAAPADGQDYAEHTIVVNSSPSEIGTTGSKYMVSMWHCVSPTTHVCNSIGPVGTWYAFRTLTGN